MVTNPEASLNQIRSQNIVMKEADNGLEAMKLALSQRDSIKFEEALAKRIQEIRRFGLDNYICMEVWSMGLVRETRRVGMTFYADYVEVDMKEIWHQNI